MDKYFDFCLAKLDLTQTNKMSSDSVNDEDVNVEKISYEN